MDILSLNADQRLFTVAASIGRDPKSWRGWHCLCIKGPSADEGLAMDSLIWTKSVVESYLKGTEGRVYACANGDIHIICKHAGRGILGQAGDQIAELISDGNQVRVSWMIYNLEEEGLAYAGNVMEQNSALFSLPVSVYAGLIPSGIKTIPEDAGFFQDSLSRRELTRVLLVEDDPVTRWLVRSALRDECRFATAPTASRAFSMVASWEPDIVFLDINLPDKNGLAVLEWIMRNDPGACVVMFSSNSNMDSIAGALEEGASGFIAKPFLKENLLHYIRRGAHAS